MRSLLSAVLLLSAFSLAAADALPRSPRPVLPDDYPKSPCAPGACDSFAGEDFRSAAFRFLGLGLDVVWFDAHEEEMRKVIQPICEKRNTCLATPGNTHIFCVDIIAQPVRETCDTRYPKEQAPHDWEQCRVWAETWNLGMSQRALGPWREAQKCAAEKTPGAMHTKPLDIWIVPEKITPDYRGLVVVYAIDPDAHIPILAQIRWEGQTIYAPSNATGVTATYYPFKGPFKLIRVPNAEGHQDLLPPMMTIQSDYYPTTTLRLPMALPKIVVEVKPDPKTFKPGPNSVTVFAHDAETGKPVEARVMLGTDVLGDTNLPLTIEKKKKEKLPEIWLTSLFDQYSDTVAVPAEK